MEKVAAEKLEAEADTIVLLFIKSKILEHVEVEMNDALGFVARMRKFSFGQRARDGKKAIRYTLHRGDNDDDVRGLGSRANESCGVQHALGPKQRGAAELQGDNGLIGDLASAIASERKGFDETAIRCHFFLQVFRAHHIRSWFPLERLWRGFKRRNPPPGSLLAVGSKLFLTC